MGRLCDHLTSTKIFTFKMYEIFNIWAPKIKMKVAMTFDLDWLIISNKVHVFLRRSGLVGNSNRLRLIYLNLKCLSGHKVVDFWSKGQIINFQTRWRYSFHMMFKLGYTTYFVHWDWLKDMICRSYIIEKIEIWVPKIHTKF